MMTSKRESILLSANFRESTLITLFAKIRVIRGSLPGLYEPFPLQFAFGCEVDQQRIAPRPTMMASKRESILLSANFRESTLITLFAKIRVIRGSLPGLYEPFPLQFAFGSEVDQQRIAPRPRMMTSKREAFCYPLISANLR